MNAAPKHVVVVNDDPTQLNVLAGLLRKAGVEPRVFAGAETALAVMTAEARAEPDAVSPAGEAPAGPRLPALIVTDLYMPGIDGWRFCRLLRSAEYAVFNQVPILVVSATFAGEAASRITADLGVEAFMAAPVDGPRFVEQVQAILRGEQLRHPMRVLIVDDNEPLCDLLREVFTSNGYAADSAYSFQAATAAFAGAAYDVAVLDYHLYDGKGDALLERFRAQRPGCVLLMMTTDPGPELALNWMKRGAAAYLHKPFQPEYLLELCAKACRERTLLRVQDLLDVRTRELRESEAQLHHAQKMEMVGRLAGGVAHDFNNMLQAILGNVDFAERDLPTDTALYESLEEIRRCAQRSADLTWRLLAFARKQKVSPRVLDLNQAVMDTLKMIHRLIGEDITLAWKPAVGLWAVRIDPTQVDQILANLCINARDAIAGVGTLTIETANAVVGEADCAKYPDSRPGDYVRLVVSDSGSGMDRETLAHIFEPFFTTKRPGEGTGLGLATVWGIVQQNQGFLDVRSEPGQGATFEIFLPRFSGRAAPARSAAPAAAPGGSGETVLLVEDDPAILTIARRIIEKLGYSVLTAAKPGEALELARTQAGPIDLLITDVVMPEMNGRELARQLLESQPGLRCLYMSGHTSSVIAPRGVLADGLHFIQKPFTTETLAAKMRIALEAE